MSSACTPSKEKKNDLVLNVSGMPWVILKGNSGHHGGLVSQKNSKQLFSRITKHLHSALYIARTEKYLTAC